MIHPSFDIDRIKNFFRGNYSEKDSAYVDEIFCDDSKEAELKEVLSEQFEAMASEEKGQRGNLDQLLYKIHYEINTNLSVDKGSSIQQLSRWTLRIAAVLMLPLFLLIGIESYKQIYLKKETWVEIKAPAWTRAQFSLPDGTKGWLNSSSSIKYKGDFYEHRQLELKGEAYFDVFKDKDRPFLVDAKDISVRVLGTRFNIASYENEKSVEIVLEEGKIELKGKSGEDKYTLKPNDLVIYDKEHKSFSREVVQPQKYIAWTDGKLVFRNDPLDVIVRRLERWYNIEIETKGNLNENLRLRATFIDEDIEEVLSLLKRSLPITYTIENRLLKPDETYAKKKVVVTCKNR